MLKMDSVGSRLIFSILLIVGLLYLPAPVFSQDSPNIQNVIVNGGFEEGFQGDFGVGYGWGGFSNGNAIVGWNGDSWDKVVAAGQNAQMIEIKNSTELDRYAGIYQTVPVVPGQQYKLTIEGLIRSTEGDIEISDYGYRLQYAIDYQGGTTWELIDNEEWHELTWNEQPLELEPEETYRLDSFETTITAKSDQLTLFIRGWKKWLNNGSGIFNLDEISLVGPAPDGFAAPLAQLASVGPSSAPADTGPADTEPAAQPDPPQEPETPDEATLEIGSQTEPAGPVEAVPQAESAQLPVSGQGSEGLNYIIVSSAILLLVLFAAAISTAVQKRHPLE